MEWLFQSGHVAFLLLFVMAVEAVVLAQRFKTAYELFAGLAAGACLVLALRAALLDQNWIVISLFLLAGFAFHALELSWRLGRLRRSA